MMRPQGSIFSVKNKSGRTVYKVEVSVGKRADGTRRRIRRTAETLVEAQELRIQLLSQKQLGELSEGRNERLDSFALWWLRTVKAQEVRPATALQGPIWWLFEGETLASIRERLDDEW
jgi:hypothetical protein